MNGQWSKIPNGLVLDTGRLAVMIDIARLLIVAWIVGHCLSTGWSAEPPFSPQVHRGDGWSIAGPGDWKVSRLTPPGGLNLSGDGAGGAPNFDGTLSALQAGLLIRIFPEPKVSVRERADGDVAALKADPRVKLREEPRIEELKLSDGVDALLLAAEFERTDKQRLSLYQMLYCADLDGRHVVATGFYSCSLAGGGFVKAVGHVDYMQAHLKSLVLDSGKLDEKSLAPVYESRNWRLNEAFEKTRQGNRFIAEEAYSDAIGAFRDALAICDHLSAAHNGLAWSLVMKKEANAEELAEGMKHAKIAVEQTENRDANALDTLAQAQFKSGAREQAVQTIRKALEIKPNDAHFREQLRTFENAQ
jgi:tetratricopeptide (TPR) repeat protein